MSEEFKVGEVAILCNLVDFAGYNGRECVITEPLRNGRYGISIPGDSWWEAAHKSKLRKKQPPRSAKSIMREAILKAQQPAKVPE